MSRLDRLLCLESGMNFMQVQFRWAFPDMCQTIAPINMSTKEIDWGPRSFRFENCWLLHKDFSTTVREWWAQLKFKGLAGFSGISLNLGI